MYLDIRIDDFSYELPAARIAAFPLSQRDRSKLMVCRQGKPESSHFYKIDCHLENGSLLVMNDTRVVQARLLFKKKSGARIEVFCLKPLWPSTDTQLSLGMREPVEWLCLVGHAKKWKSEELVLTSGEQGLMLTAEKIERTGEEFRIRFSWSPQHLSFAEVLELAGKTPLPPYIQREAEPADKISYQTVYARHDGSVAAPTAGLHFTPDVIQKLRKKNIQTQYLTLHVGAGTFKPVSVPTIGRHLMHSEQFQANRSLLESLAETSGSIVSVGTTSMRTLESLFWIGAKMFAGEQPGESHIRLDQWFPYSWKGDLPTRRQAMQSIIEWLDKEKIDKLYGETILMIVPGYQFQMTDVLITNFHQPRSTLLLLVAAFAGPSWKIAYQYALDNDFRFLSYGDSCLFFRDRGLPE